MKPKELEEIVEDEYDEKQKLESDINWESSFIRRILMEKGRLSFRQVYDELKKEVKKRDKKIKLEKPDEKQIKFWDEIARKNLAIEFLKEHLDALTEQKESKARYFLRMNGIKFPFKELNEVYRDFHCDQIAYNLSHFISAGAVEYKNGFYCVPKAVTKYSKLLDEMEQIPDDRKGRMDYAG